MLFTSAFFITIFLPSFLLATYAAPPRWRNNIALVFSLFFYFWGAASFLPTVLIMGAIDYAVSRKLANARRPRLMLTLGICAQLSVLLYYKYLNFVAAQSVALLGYFGFESPWSVPNVVLPLGVSFIVFEQISYLVDCYRKDATPARSLPDYWTFLLLFPHSISGPIFRWQDLEAKFRHRELDDLEIARGVARFAFGFFKKAVLADAVAHVATNVFGLPPEELGFGIAWIGGAFYAMQMYLDFSAYSDMAIGLGQMIGFRFKENFLFPFHTRSIGEFWSRWHVSLSTWFRIYVYIPLGGNRTGLSRTARNLMLVFVISGLWHGATWTAVGWGVYTGATIIIERVTRLKSGFVITQMAFIVGMAIFNARDLPYAGHMLQALAGLKGMPVIYSRSIAQILPLRGLYAALVGIAVIWGEPTILAWIRRMRPRRVLVFSSVAMTLAMAAIAGSTYNPFIYFRF